MDAQGIFCFARRQTEGAAYCLACPYFKLGPMLIFPFPFPPLSVKGSTLSDQVGSFSLVPKIELHAL